jgi:prepilin-type N-terminal cleavage/methylation domain-containing protein
MALQSLQMRQRGFSLMEMAIVMTILGILLSGVLVGISTSTENNRRTTARNTLRQIEEALYGYAQITGYLPCPADDDTSGQADPPGSGNCNINHGFVPSATLGFFGAIDNNGLLTDPWGNPYRYSIAPQDDGGGNQIFSSSTELDALFNSGTAITSTTYANLIRVCDTSDCSGNILTDIAPVLIYSMGEDWAAYSSANEIQNSGNGTTTSTSGDYRLHDPASNDFVSATYAEDQYDDILVWLSPHLLFNRMVSAGRLP